MSQAGEPLRLQEVARRAELPKPTAHRLLRALAELGYIEEADASSAFRATSKVLELVPADNDRWLRERAEGPMRELHEAIDETVNLACLEAGRIRYVHILESTRALRWTPDDRLYDELLTTALGRAMAARWPEERLERELPALCEKAGYADVADMREALAEARARGWAWESQQNCEGVDCVAVPLMADGVPYAGVSVSMPTVRMDADRRQAITERLLALAGAVETAREADV